MCEVSVLMSVYNENNEYLKSAIESILQQTFQDFEFIIYDDNTSSENKLLLNEYAEKDSRIKIIRNEKNRGLTYNLACGVNISQGKYIARMDSDDISKISRLEKQVRYMENHTDIALMNTNVHIIGARDPFIKHWMTTSNYLKAKLLLNNGMPHPTAIMRKSFLDKHNINYDINIKKTQDYDLWVQIAKKGKIAFLREPLVYYRVHDGQISKDHSGEQRQYRNQIRLQQLTDLGIQLSPEEKDIYLSFCDGKSGWKIWRNKKTIWNIRNGIIKKNVYSNFWIKYLFWKRLFRNCIT